MFYYEENADTFITHGGYKLANLDKSPLSTDTKMQVSGLLHREEGKSVCVMIEDKEKSLEVRLPAGEILFCQGYTQDEANAIISYLNENISEIMKTAGGVNPMKAFMS